MSNIKIKKVPEILPSILSSCFLDIKENLEILEGKFKKLHIDIMDGVFVKNLSFGPMIVEEINSSFNFEIDLHLMVMNPLKFINLFENCCISSISIHYEALTEINNALEGGGIEMGLALNPSTIIPSLNILKKFDYIDIMSVDPGFGGQKFIPETRNKLQSAKKIIYDNNLDLKIQVDGGINKRNINNILELDIDRMVIGSGIFQGNLIENVYFFDKLLTRYNKSS